MIEKQSHARSWQINVVIALLILLLGAVISESALKSGASLQQQQQQQIRWEYAVGIAQDGKLAETINKYGAEGWELVSARRGELSTKPQAAAYEIIVRRPSNAPKPQF